MELLIKTNKNGMTKLLVSIPISQREALTRISQQSGLSQQGLIRAGIAMAIAQYDKPATRKTKPITPPVMVADEKPALKIAKPEKTPVKKTTRKRVRTGSHQGASK